MGRLCARAHGPVSRLYPVCGNDQRAIGDSRGDSGDIAAIAVCGNGEGVRLACRAWIIHDLDWTRDAVYFLRRDYRGIAGQGIESIHRRSSARSWRHAIKSVFLDHVAV